jgi:hypothetical protein
VAEVFYCLRCARRECHYSPDGVVFFCGVCSRMVDLSDPDVSTPDAAK